MLCNNRFGWFTWFSRSSFINGNNAELIFVAFSQVLHSILCIWCWVVVNFDPFTSAFSFFNVISSDWFTTGECWRIPSQRARRRSITSDFRLAWRIWWIKWTFSYYRFAFQWFGNTVDIFGTYAENVFLSFG